MELAILRERNRIAREIHDAIGHTLSSSILQVEALKLSTADCSQIASYDLLQKTLQNGMFDIRRSLHHLHSSSLDLNQEFSTLKIANPHLNIEIICQCNEETMNYAFKRSLFSIIQEAITNINKHSANNNVMIRLVENPDFYSLNIKDYPKQPESSFRAKNNEINFPIDVRPGIGFLSMQEFAARYKGHMNYGWENGFYIHIVLKKEDC